VGISFFGNSSNMDCETLKGPPSLKIPSTVLERWKKYKCHANPLMYGYRPKLQEFSCCLPMSSIGDVIEFFNKITWTLFYTQDISLRRILEVLLKSQFGRFEIQESQIV
jgi:hypothetical protein